MIGAGLLWFGWFGFNGGSALAADGGAAMAIAATHRSAAAARLVWVGLEWFRFKIDASLDVFAVHGVGSILGTLGVAFLALPAFGGLGLSDRMTAGGQFGIHAIGAVATVVWSVLASAVMLLVVRALVGLRVDTDSEIEGLDVTVHGERSYML